MDSATRLINSLAGERKRWTHDAKMIGEKKKQLIGNVAMCCEFLSYCGPFNAEYRTTLMTNFGADMRKRHIPLTPSFEYMKFLVDETTIGEWNLQGLPKDELSL